ncbi:hypothetical protein GpartN1_g6584.t1 [Galdieria partita]|uniref:Archaeal ATPase n=1 Tax=Galdieria partita TaxID=83374 RepID=A0A9C7Q1K5_9RHOD|nr:hypothetical protein GpartN1_g6584.t1 [Galdieria partita]
MMRSLGERWATDNTFKPVFVDREEDVSLVTRKLYELHKNRKQLKGQSSSLNYRLTVPFAPHMFGSGKTTFCVNYLELIRRFSETSIASFASNSSKKEFLDKLKTSNLLYVDLRVLEQTDPEERSLEWAIYYLMVKNACSRIGVPVMRKRQAFETVEMEPSNLVALLRDKLNIPTNQYLLVVFDEIGALDESYGEFDFERTQDGEVFPYNDFFDIVRRLCKQDNVFFIVVGKSEGLRIKNSVTVGPRVLLHFISLSPLSSSNIVEFLEKSHLEEQFHYRVCDILCSSSFSVDELAEALLECTGGVPGLVTRAVNMLLNYVQTRGQSFRSKDECLSCMNEDGFQRICAEPFIQHISTSDEDKKTEFGILLMMALFHIPFKLYDELNSECYLFDAVNEMGLYRYPIDQDTFQVLIPKVFVGNFEHLSSLSLLEQILLGSLKLEPVDCFFSSKCRVFEGIVAIRLILMLSSKVRNEFRELLCQLSAVFKEMKLPIREPSPLDYMRSVGVSESRSESNKKRKTYGSNEWNKNIQEALYFDRVYIPVDTNSRSPDIIFKLQSPVDSKVLIVGVACKGRWNSERIGWSDIIEEAEKFLVPVSNQVLSNAPDKNHCMLIVVGTKLSFNVASELGDQSRCYSSGMSIESESFTIPSNCELVILCERDVEMLIDKEILNGLERAFSSTDRPLFGDFGPDLLRRVRHSFLSWQ